MKIAIIGSGYVGLTTGVCLADFGWEVMCLDIDNTKVEKLSNGIMTFYEPGMQELLDANLSNKRLRFSSEIGEGICWADVIFIAVGTPQREDGSADLTAVFKVAKVIGENLNSYKIIVTKSTVPIGTNEKIKEVILSTKTNINEFDIVSNPEFLREGQAVYDFLHPDRVVIGTDSQRPIEALKSMYRPLCLNQTPFVFTNLRTSEMIKYSSNCFLATKVAFINEISRLCDATGADVKTIAYAMGMDERIGNKFLHPGPGYGGSCFPKDTEALAAIGRRLDIPLNIIENVIESNKIHKSYVFKKIKDRFKTLKGVRLGVLGLAFKSETDDMRESASIVIVNKLLEEGACIRVFDPRAMSRAKKIWRNSVYFGNDEYDTVSTCDGVVILTEWNQFRNLSLNRVSYMMNGDKIFDFRSIYSKKEVEKYGLTYIGIGGIGEITPGNPVIFADYV